MNDTLGRLGNFSLLVFTLIAPTFVLSFSSWSSFHTPLPLFQRTSTITTSATASAAQSTRIRNQNMLALPTSASSKLSHRILNSLSSHCYPSLSRCRAKTRLYSSKYSHRKERKEVAKKQGKKSTELDWEHYEFSQK